MKRKALSLILAAVMTASAAVPAACYADSAAESAADSDVAYIQDKGTLVVGITDFQPMDYKDADGNWIGFDADLATKVAEDLGVQVEFIEIDWDNKILELQNKNIDCVWNGMTLTDEVKETMNCTKAYCANEQVVVLNRDIADQYQDVDSLKDLTFAVESGSAGEQAANDLGLDVQPFQKQSDALLEVQAGTSDACIIDLLMASATIGEGTDYPDLTYTVGLTSEEYGIGCRVGSDLTDYINAEMDKFYADGTIDEVAETYNLTGALIRSDESGVSAAEDVSSAAEA